MQGRAPVLLLLSPLFVNGHCPNDCGLSVGHGTCSFDAQPVCLCNAPWTGNDCSERACPTALAWFDRPVAENTAHTTAAVCAGRGRCDMVTGTCICDDNYEGDACQRSQCGPGGRSGVCNRNGRCVTLRDAGRLRPHDPVDYSEWDADRIMICLCDEGWGAFDCSERLCPQASDPLAVGVAEVQTITTAVPYSPEVQTVTVSAAGTGGSGGGVDVDEVQAITLSWPGSGPPPTGFFTISLDCRSTSTVPGCALWPDSRRVLQTTEQIDILSGSPALTAVNVRGALDGLTMLGPGQVDVTATWAAASLQIGLKFRGAAVAGALPLVVVNNDTVAVVGGTVTSAVTRVAAGSEVAGTLALSWNDAGSYPNQADLQSASSLCADLEDKNLTAPLGLRSTNFSVTGTEAVMQAALTAMVFGCAANVNGLTVCTETPVAGAIAVSKTPSGGPGLSIAVTFAAGARARGDVAPLTVAAATALTVKSPTVPLTGASASASVAETTRGAFMSGTWGSLSLPYRTPDTASTGEWGSTPALGSTLSWCVQPSVIAALVNAIEGPLGLGMVTVSRTRAPAAGLSVWTGGYTWSITYRGITESVPLLTADSSSLSSPTIEVSRLQAGSPLAEVAEVQLIDCTCPTCSSPSHYIRLAFGAALTAPIHYSADADAVRAALRALPGVPDVVVAQLTAGGSQAFGMCTPLGTTTAITFAYNGGMQPPLHLAGMPVKDGSTLPPSAKVRMQYGRGWGLQGGRARRGTRKLWPCSRRGVCNVITGACTCYAGWGDGDGGLRPEALPLPAASALDIADAQAQCGFATGVGGVAAVIKCPASSAGLVCGGLTRGSCSGPPEYVCACKFGYSDPACGSAACATDYAWGTVPVPPVLQDDGVVSPGPGGSGFETTIPSAHATSSCSNHGRCQASTGSCQCMTGWMGSACSLMPCPGADFSGLTACEGAPCVSLSTLAEKYLLDPATGGLMGPGSVDIANRGANNYTLPWDKNGQMRGCVCESLGLEVLGPFALNAIGRTGYDCSTLTCPGGPDPADYNAFSGVEETWEMQMLRCEHSAAAFPLGRLAFAFRNVSGSVRVRLDALVRDADKSSAELDMFTLEAALRSVPGVSPFTLQVLGGSAQPVFCDPSGGTSIQLTFVGRPGSQPLIVMTPNSALANSINTQSTVRTRAGTGRYIECNNRGVCDRGSGKCSCMPGFDSSDGRGNAGQLGDCGHNILAGLG
jgi:hypothetical protein